MASGLLVKAQSIDRDVAVILITGHGDVALAVNAMRLGAYDFVEKPFPPIRLVEMAARAAEHRGLVLQVRALRAQLADQCGIEASILGSSICRTLRIPKRTLYDKMRKLGLSTEEFHASDARGRRS